MTVRKLLALPLAFTGGVILASFTGCTETNDNHCSAKGGDVFCQEKTGKAEGEVFCTNNCGGDYDFDGCLVAEEPPAEGCWLCDGEGSANCGSIGDGDSDSTDSDTTMDTGSTDDATETMDTETTAETGPECMDSAECPGEMPLCEDGACVGCGDAVVASCDAEYPETPACDAGSGECKLCTGEDAAMCMGTTPVCEGFACVGCSEHAQCAESACNMATGGCMDPDRVWWVDQSVGGPGTGTEMDPYKEFAPALSNIGAGQAGVIYLATPSAHLGKFEVLGGRTVALLGKSAMGKIQSDGAPAIDLNQNSQVFVHDVWVAGGNDVGLACAGCSVWVSNSRIVKSSLGAVMIDGGDVAIWNSFVGMSAADAPAIAVQSGNVEILYSTVIGGTAASPALQCDQGGGVVVRNSIVASRDAAAEIVCDEALVSDSAVEMDLAGNTMLDSMVDGSWFSSYNEGDFHLSAMAPQEIETSAVWQAGDPKRDIDGEPRPTTDGSPDYAGADVSN